MPRSKTRARLRKASMGSSAVQFDPELTPGRLGHFRRTVWRRFATLGDYPRRQPETEDRKARKLAILSQIDDWFAEVINRDE